MRRKVELTSSFTSCLESAEWGDEGHCEIIQSQPQIDNHFWYVCSTVFSLKGRGWKKRKLKEWPFHLYQGKYIIIESVSPKVICDCLFTA